MSELAWGWSQIATVLMWRLAPKGLVLYRRDLTLPRDRVLLEERQPTYIHLSFVPLEQAFARTHTERIAGRATTDKLTGRWQQIACVMLWKLRKHGIRLTPQDADAVPKHLELLTTGHPDGVEWRFLPRIEARALDLWNRENEGKVITEGVQ